MDPQKHQALKSLGLPDQDIQTAAALNIDWAALIRLVIQIIQAIGAGTGGGGGVFPAVKP